LELWRVGWQKEQMHMVGDTQMGARVPAGTIQDEHNLLGRSCPDRVSEGSEFPFEKRD
jgi:hypothetical protein